MLKRLLPAVMGYLMVAMNVAETQNSGAETKSSGAHSVKLLCEIHKLRHFSHF